MTTSTVYFTAKNGAEATITGDVKALDAIEKLFKRAGIRWNEQIGTWDEGYYDDEPDGSPDQPWRGR